jgi:hypothetical protein
MDQRIRSFEHQVATPGLFVLAMDKYLTLNRDHLPRVKYFDLQSLIR